MRNRFFTASTIIAVLAVCAVLPRAGSAQDVGLEIGAAPAAVTVANLDGQPVDFAQFVGKKPVVLEFWATWCEPCDRQIPHLNRWHQQYADKGLAIVALSDEEPDQLRKYAKEARLTYPIATDPDDRVRSLYLVSGLPTTILIDKTGVVRYVAIGSVKPSELEAQFTRLMR